MATLNINTNCGTGAGNTGMPDCVHNPDLIVGSLKIPKGTVYTATQMIDFRDTLQNGLINNTYASRIQRVGRFLEIDDQSEDRQQKTWGYGDKSTTRQATYDWVFYYTDGAMCMHKTLKRFSGRQNEYDELLIDASNNIIGTEGVDANGVPGLAGVNLREFYVGNWKPATGSDPVMYMCNYKFADPKQLNERYAYITVDFDPFTLDAVKDVVLAPIGSTNVVDATGAINIAITGGCGGQNLVKLYGSTIANTARFLIKNKQTGGTITLTGVTIAGSGDGQYLAFNMDDTDTDYPAAGEYLTIQMVDVSTLHTALGDYLESNVLTLETL